MIKIVTAFIFAICASTVAEAQTTFVSPAGTDTGNCQNAEAPCATMQYAENQVTGTVGSIVLADGIYEGQTLNVQYYRCITVTGDVVNPAAVVIDGPSGATVMQVQDHGILIVKGVTINAPSGIAVYSRQFSIFDLDNSVVGSASVGVSAQEKSKGNLYAVTFTGAFTYPVAANDGSTLDLSAITVAPGTSAYSFVWAEAYSLVNAATNAVTGNIASGAQYILDNAELQVAPYTLPGNAAANIAQHNAIIE